MEKVRNFIGDALFENLLMKNNHMIPQSVREIDKEREDIQTYCYCICQSIMACSVTCT